MEIATAYKLYLSILHLYSATDFHDDHDRVHVSSEIGSIYSKLLLFSKMKQANRFLSTNDLAGLSDTLEDIGRILRPHEKDTSYFYSYAKSLYKHYSISAIRLGGQYNA